MKSNRAHILFILDKSGSMQSLRGDAIGGFNSLVEEQKKLPGEALLTFVTFNDSVSTVYTEVELANVPTLTEADYVPSGLTAMLDAIGGSIDRLGEQLARMPEEERPAKIVVAIMTDGMENASKDYGSQRVADMIKHQQEKYNWEFIFLGANIDAPAVAASLNIPRKSALNYAATSEGVQTAYRSVSNMVSRSRKGD